MTRVVNVPGRLHSVEQGNILTGANEIYDDTKLKKQNVINGETDAELLRLDQTKQDNLTFDTVPTEGSTNPITSGGVYASELTLSQAIEAILLLIPSAASALNKLADVAFVNSTVATASATFRGTYNLVSDLHLSVSASHQDIATALGTAISTADNNDYAFVQVPVSDTSQDIRVTERYKFNGTAWAFEYDLNNSGFTAAQWAAINSAITAALVQKLQALPTDAELSLLLAAKQAVLSWDTTPTSGSTNPVTSGGLYEVINAITTVIPSAASADNKLVDEARMASFTGGFALKSEMSVQHGTGGNAGKTTIQLKSGTSTTVLTDTLINVTYADLVTLRNGGNLIKGQFYRITDFVTTVGSSLTEVRSAGHAFDLIVQALDVDTISEDAKAIQHAGDTYFQNSKLEAWQIKYSLDNDTTRFEWADSTNGKGVIWRMVDEFENDIPHDFKNIQYKMYKVTDSHLSRTTLNGKYLGFKDGLNAAMQLTIEDNTDFIWAYTFSTDATGGSQTDRSLAGTCHGNTLTGVHMYFVSYAACESNKFDAIDPCYVSIGGTTAIDGNVIGFSQGVVVGERLTYNNIGVLYRTSLGNCYYNNIHNVSSSSIGTGFTRNIGVEISSCELGNIFQYNRFGVMSHAQTGDTVFINDFGEYFNYCTLSSNVQRCKFEGQTKYITIGKDYFFKNIIEEGNDYLTITSTQTTGAAAPLCNIKICQGVGRGTQESERVTISHNTVGDTFETEYKPQNSQTVFV